MAQRKARLPNDIIGQLEDRITDDKTDFAAYEELIAKYKEKSKIDEARQTYQRLLKVLPASVSAIHESMTDDRLTYGDSMRKWKRPRTSLFE